MKFGVRVLRGLSAALFVLGVGMVGSIPVAIATADLAAAQTAASIVVEGNRRVEADTIRSYFKTPSGRLDAAAIDAGLKSLYATGLFQDVRINQSGGRLVVTVVENPVINRVAFEGNKKVKDEQLNLELQSKPRGTFSRPVVQADVQRIVEIYRRNGRFDIRVEPKIIELPNNRVDLVFEIIEGPKTGVKRLVFVGNRSYSDYRLREIIKTSQSNWLSWLQTGDIYDPDRIEADRDIIRRFYLKRGYADVRVVSVVGEYDPALQGFVVTFTIDEGDRYRFGRVGLESNVRAFNPDALRSRLLVVSGDVYNAELIEKSTENMTIEAARLGYPFASVRPRGERNFETRTIDVTFILDDGPRVYIERINIRGNTRTQDSVIRREFDIAEGDAYNRALMDRAERRLKNLGYFKTVKVSPEPGSVPDRVVINVEVEEQSTGELSVSGGYSTADGFLAELSVGERNLLGRGLYAKASVQYGQKTRGFDLSFADPYFLGYRMVMGLDFYSRQTFASSFTSYDSTIIGGGMRLGFALREDLSLQLRYGLSRQSISLPSNLNDCTAATLPPFSPSCYANGESSIPVRIELTDGPKITSSVGYTLAYNTLDNNRSPTNGWLGEFRQDFAGVGGDVNYIRSGVDVRRFHEVLPDVVGILRAQAGYLQGWGGHDLRMLDHFKMGPNLVRGFAPSGLGPRDTTPGLTGDALGGTIYWGTSLELQTPLYFLPKEVGIKWTMYADAGSVWDYKGPTTLPSTGETLPADIGDRPIIRTSVGTGLIWDSPFGPLRFDYAFPLTKGPFDRTQYFRFGGGTKF